VGKSECRDCELLKDYYWLKVNRFLLTLRSFTRPYLVGSASRADQDQEIKDAKEQALQALCALISHLKVCYELDREHAA
jgi:hypothetical protein